jgi:predicted DsbA family dithiol-disulfide isomerase
VHRRRVPVKARMSVRIEVWSDVVCPWCNVGKRRLEKALARFEHADEVEVVWRSFQLEATFGEGVRKPVHEDLAEKFGTSIAQAREMTDHVKGLAAQEGLAFDAGRAWMVNTLDAHRVAHLAKGHGLLGQMHERLMRAHHIEGEMLDDSQTLVRLADEVGVPGDEVRRVLAGNEYAEQVREDIRQAAELGASGVPFFVLNGAYSISGAQPVDMFLTALRTAYDHAATPTR